LDNVRCEGSRNCRAKKKECPKQKINALETYSKNKNITNLYKGINKFKKDYKPIFDRRWK
jgi:hypothetical protein